MNSSTSFTAVATSDSDVAERAVEAFEQATVTRTAERIAHLEEIRRTAERLEERGLLKRQNFSEASTADLRRQYLGRMSY